MPGYSPIQEAFNAGEVSRRFSGQTNSPLCRRGLALCRNFIPLPHGSLLRRPGTRDRGLFAGALRVIPFATSSGAVYSLILSDGQIRIMDADGSFVPLYTNWVVNGGFHSGLKVDSLGAGWYYGLGAGGSSQTWNSGGYCHMDSSVGEYPSQTPNLTAGAYTLRIRAKRPTANDDRLRVWVQSHPGDVSVTDTLVALTPNWANYEVKFNVGATAGLHHIYLQAQASPPTHLVDIDDVVLTRDDDDGGGADPYMTTVWGAAAVPYIQYDQDSTKNVMVLTHPDGIRLVHLTSHGMWFIEEIPWISKPVEWVDGNYPAAVEHGYQGRLWFAGAPDQPNVFKASKSGAPFDFTTGVNADDAMSWNASLRGAINWIRGHLSFLIGAALSEQSANGSGAVIAPDNPPEVRDESVFGSARMQVAMAGDEVLFVTKDRSTIRALSFDANGKNGWVSNPVSFTGHHLVKNVKEIHFAYSPDPLLIAVRTNDTVVACSYKKDAQGLITAWFRTDLLATSAAVLETTNGSVLRMLVARADGVHVEDLPLHETGVDYLDGWSSGVVTADGEITGLARFNGSNVRVKVDGVSIGTFVVAGGKVTGIDLEYAGEAAVVGLTYTATAKTLPLEGGDPTGTSQGKAIHWSEVAIRLNDSARPLVCGERAGLGKPFGPSMDALETLLTADVRVSTLEVSEGGEVTIEQSEPYRTEICGLFGQAEVSRV